jgi:hypothetical protein
LFDQPSTAAARSLEPGTAVVHVFSHLVSGSELGFNSWWLCATQHSSTAAFEPGIMVLA